MIAKQPLYVAGPYAAPTAEGIAKNVRRACALGHLAAHQGYAVIVPHAMGSLGVYGAADESVPGVRKCAIESGVALAAMVGSVFGRMYIIRKKDHCALADGLSTGTMRELLAFQKHQKDPRAVVMFTWEKWKPYFDAYNLLPAYEAAD